MSSALRYKDAVQSSIKEDILLAKALNPNLSKSDLKLSKQKDCVIL